MFASLFVCVKVSQMRLDIRCSRSALLCLVVDLTFVLSYQHSRSLLLFFSFEVHVLCPVVLRSFLASTFSLYKSF